MFFNNKEPFGYFTPIHDSHIGRFFGIIMSKLNQFLDLV